MPTPFRPNRRAENSPNEEIRKALTNSVLLEEQIKADKPDEITSKQQFIPSSESSYSLASDDGWGESRKPDWLISIPTVWSDGTFAGPSSKSIMSGIRVQYLLMERLGITGTALRIWNFADNTPFATTRTTIEGWRVSLGLPVYLTKAIFIEPEWIAIWSKTTSKNYLGQVNATPQVLQQGWGANLGANLWIPVRRFPFSLGLTFQVGVHAYRDAEGYAGKVAPSTGFGLCAGF